MIRSALIESTFAAARQQLELARVAQHEAIAFGLRVYRPGRAGATARVMRESWDRRRREHLEAALGIRSKIPALRAELARLSRAATLLPPPPDAALHP